MAKKHVILSYCRENQAEVSRLRTDLLKAGEAVWWDQDVLPGKDWKLEIRQAIKDAHAFLLCLSSESSARIISGIYPEVLDAIAAYREYSPGEVFIIPVRLSECVVPPIEIDSTRSLDRLQYQDLFPASNYASGLEKLIQAIKATPFHPLAGSQKSRRPARANQQVSATSRRWRGIGDARTVSIGGWTNERCDGEYDRQLYALPETELLRKIRSEPFCRMVVRPSEFKKARFQTIEGCRDFVVSCCIDVRSWLPYLHILRDGLEQGSEWVGGEVEHKENGVTRRQRWALFRSGQFVHSRNFDKFPGIGDRIDILDILDIVTGTFELIARMTDRGFLSAGVAVTFELRRMDGVGLNFPPGLPRRSGIYWCQDESINIARNIELEELRAMRRRLALEAAVEIYNRFGWTDVPEQWLMDEQNKRFGTWINAALDTPF